MTVDEKKQHLWETWFAMWDILIPGVPRPKSPCKLLRLEAPIIAKLTSLRSFGGRVRYRSLFIPPRYRDGK
jgi:hypothetical protein